MVSNTAHGLFHPKCNVQKYRRYKIRNPLVSQVSQLVVMILPINDCYRHVISRDYITHEFRVIPKHLYLN